MNKNQYQIPCKNFIESLLWTFQYYYHGCPSWTWYYRYRHAPPFEDICRYLEDDLKKINTIQWKPTEPYTPFQQLMTVLPKSSMSLLPKSYQTLLLNKDIRIEPFFPIDFQVDTLFHVFYWQCLPVLPVIDNQLLLKVIKKCRLTTEEKMRNKYRNCFSNKNLSL